MDRWTGTSNTPTHLKPWGGVWVRVRTSVGGIQPKGVKCYCLGYSKYHFLGTYDMYVVPIHAGGAIGHIQRDIRDTKDGRI